MASGVATRHPTIRIGVSACLLGQNVRYDGGNKRDTFLVDTLGKYVEFIPVCPEVELGLETPRDTIRLVRVNREVRMVVDKSGEDLTQAMLRFSRRRLRDLSHANLAGYVFKRDSPSCGMERVRIDTAAGGHSRNGRGLFAEALLRHFPNLPVEDEGRLTDPTLRENFIERTFAYHRLQTLFAGKWTPGDLVSFHTAHKLVLSTHSPRSYSRLGRLVSQARSLSKARVRRKYESEFMAALRIPATHGRHAKVMAQIAGYFEDVLDDASYRKLLATLEDYRKRRLPRRVTMTLIRHHLKLHPIRFLETQIYINPHPEELLLRSDT